MKNTLNDTDRKILAAIQHGMPNSLTPYKDLADEIGMTTEDLLENLRNWQETRKIRRLGAIVNHFKLGRGTGAMVVWDVPKEDIEKIGELFASFPDVSHAYQRPTSKAWPFSLYTMVHASSVEELESTLQKMSDSSGVTNFSVLKTVRELKKVPPTYIVK